MHAIQYTIRKVPRQIDQALRKRARITGKSLNQIIIEDLAAQTGVSIKGERKTLLQQLDWFIGSNSIDDQTLEALADQDKADKERAKRDWEFDS